MSKNFDETVHLQSEKRQRVDTRDEKIETTRDYIGHEYRSPSGQLISRVVPWKKRVSGDPLQPDKTVGDRKQFMPDLPERLR